MRFLPTLAAALLAVPAAAQVRVANAASDRLARLDVIPRRAALRAALLDSGLYCKRVEKAAPQGPFRNLMMWRAACDLKDPRLDYAVFIGPDGTVQARHCTELAELKLPLCRPFR